MNLRGNHMFFNWMTAISGIVTLVGCVLWGDKGLAGMLIFFVGLVLTFKPEQDEREMQLTYKAVSLEAIPVSMVLGLIYVAFPEVNWFHTYVCVGLLARGTLGLVIFSRQ